MYAPNLPEPWMIHHIEQLRRIRESESRDGAQLPLHPPPPPSIPALPHEQPSERRSVVVIIDLA